MMKIRGKLLPAGVVVLLIAFILGSLKGMFETIIFLAFVGVIYQMFFSKNRYKDENPQEPPKHSKDYVTPVKEKDGYTPEPPTGQARPYAETLPVQAKKDKDSYTVGFELSNGREFDLSDQEFNAMCLLLGATGAGKTTAIKTILDNPMKNNYPIIIIDGKGSPSFYQDIEKTCKKYNRNFKLFHMGEAVEGLEASKHYSFLRHGGFTEQKDKLISIFDWTEEHYKLQCERFLQGLFKLLQMPETKGLLQVEVIDFNILCQLLNLDNLKSLAENLGEVAMFMTNILNEVDEGAIKGLANRIQSIAESELGELFNDTKDQNVIDLMQSIENNDVVFFSLDSLKFAEYSKMLGRLVIADLKTVSPRFYGKDKRIYCVFDEFNVFASELIVNLINKTREYGFRNIISTQELADMVINGDRKLLDQVWGNTNIKIALRQDVHSSQEELSNGINTKEVYKVTVNTGKGEDDIFGQGAKKYSTTLEEQYIYKPREFGQLGQGEAIVFVKYPKFRHSKIKIRRV